MKIIFFGSSEFAVPSLEALIKNKYDIRLVVTQPDRPKGRHLVLSPPVVKIVAQKAALEVFQPKDINDSISIKKIKDLGADLFVVISYGEILGKVLLDIPKIAINVHASLLPKYRGAAPINWALINGEKITGVTIQKMAEKMDAGGIILQKETEIMPEDDCISLNKKLSFISADLLIETLKQIENGNFELIPQNEKDATHAPKLKKEDGLIDWAKPAVQIQNRIRGLAGWPGAYSFYNGKMIKIWKAKAMSQGEFKKTKEGQIIDIGKDGILVQTGKDILLIEELQLEGSKRMDASSFIIGHHIKVGDLLVS